MIYEKLKARFREASLTYVDALDYRISVILVIWLYVVLLGVISFLAFLGTWDSLLILIPLIVILGEVFFFFDDPKPKLGIGVLQKLWFTFRRKTSCYFESACVVLFGFVLAEHGVFITDEYLGGVLIVVGAVLLIIAVVFLNSLKYGKGEGKKEDSK